MSFHCFLSLCALLLHAEGIVGDDVQAFVEDGALMVQLNGKRIPPDEGAAMNFITSWMDGVHWSPGWADGSAQKEAFHTLERMAELVGHAPWMALALGQAFLLYFWWAGQDLRVSVEAARLSTWLHHISIQFRGCDDVSLDPQIFASVQCAFRWRHLTMIPAEVGVHLARNRRELAQSAEMLRQAESYFATMRTLPHFSQHNFPSLYAVNTNSFAFPGPVNRPVWPTAELEFAQFLEAHVDVFRSDLDSLLASDKFDALYWGGEVSLTQFAPKHGSWAMVSLVKNREARPKTCALVNASCNLLLTRPELMACPVGDAGAAFARLLPGQGLRPHFWNSPRMAAHLGLYTPPGARLWVGGEEVSWSAGKAVVWDDTYIHSVLHEGTEPRYVLITWFCHPCGSEGRPAGARPHHLCAAR